MMHPDDGRSHQHQDEQGRNGIVEPRSFPGEESLTPDVLAHDQHSPDKQERLGCVSPDADKNRRQVQELDQGGEEPVKGAFAEAKRVTGSQPKRVVDKVKIWAKAVRRQRDSSHDQKG